jgi:hypothetical protein
VQLDNTRIAVRERGMIDTYDLALHVIRVFAPRLVPALLLGILPLALLNEILLLGVWEPLEAVDWMNPGEASLAVVFVPLFQSIQLTRYSWLYLVLVFFEAPVATIFAESYLGAAVFKQDKTLWESVKDVFAFRHRTSGTRSEVGPFWAFLLCQLLMRGTIVALIIPLLVWGQEFNWFLEGMLPVLLFLPVAALRAFRPYINEIIVLEKNPLWSKTAPMTVGKRSGNLHNSAGAELFGQFLGSALVAFVLLQVLFWSIWAVYVVMFGEHPGLSLPYWVPQHILRPLALWSVVAYLGVARFLSYLDLRIRQEGWEVELLVRAEAARLTEKLV